VAKFAVQKEVKRHVWKSYHNMTADIAAPEPGFFKAETGSF
jgi:hypothetical protein